MNSNKEKSSLRSVLCSVNGNGNCSLSNNKVFYFESAYESVQSGVRPGRVLA